MKKVIVAGSRNFNDFELLESRLLPLGEIEIVSGGARGADKLGEIYAQKYNKKLTVFLADWERFGKSAGYIRNKEMADYGDYLFAFWDQKSKGTEHMINLARSSGIHGEVIYF